MSFPHSTAPWGTHYSISHITFSLLAPKDTCLDCLSSEKKLELEAELYEIVISIG